MRSSLIPSAVFLRLSSVVVFWYLSGAVQTSAVSHDIATVPLEPRRFLSPQSDFLGLYSSHAEATLVWRRLKVTQPEMEMGRFRPLLMELPHLQSIGL